MNINLGFFLRYGVLPGVYLGTTCMPGACTGQKRAMDPLDLE